MLVSVGVLADSGERMVGCAADFGIWILGCLFLWTYSYGRVCSNSLLFLWACWLLCSNSLLFLWACWLIPMGLYVAILYYSYVLYWRLCSISLLFLWAYLPILVGVILCTYSYGRTHMELFLWLIPRGVFLWTYSYGPKFYDGLFLWWSFPMMAFSYDGLFLWWPIPMVARVWPLNIMIEGSLRYMLQLKLASVWVLAVCVRG